MKAVQHFLVPTVHETKHQTVFNYPLKTGSYEEVVSNLKDMFAQVPCTIKLNMAFGFVLRNVMQDSYDPYRYYYAHNYNTVFEKPIVVNNVDDLNYVQELLQDVNFAEYSVQHRNDTK